LLSFIAKTSNMAWTQKNLNPDAPAPQNQYHPLVHFRHQKECLLLLKSIGYVLRQLLYVPDH
jgi:hypothetical protein